MQWQPFPHQHPNETGTYIASINTPFGGGVRNFADAAYYDAENSRWYRIDAFDNQPNLNTEITDQVIGWIDNLGAYLGLVG